MLEYRFFVMRPDGSIKETTVQILPDDVSALESARALLTSEMIEGWQESRRVFRLMPDGSSGL